jgi:hypothetical protein
LAASWEDQLVQGLGLSCQDDKVDLIVRQKEQREKKKYAPIPRATAST